MKNTKITDIVFLGAGASKSDGAPIQSELFGDYFSKSTGTSPSDPLSIFFNDFFGIDVKSGPPHDEYPTFEEVLGVLELAISRNESFRGYPLTPANPKIQQIREELILLIAKILSQKLKGKRKVGYHHKLIERLINKNKLLNTGFISLNYDILIDNALTDIYPNYDLDYCVDFTNYEKTNDWKTPQADKSVILCKLHGSLNWLFCPTCISLSLTPKRNDAATTIIKPKKCSQCGTYSVPILIPPTFFKVMSNIYLQEVWKRADYLLLHAKRIFFCGYSFPDADVHIKYLFKRAEINRKKPLEVFIINHYEGKEPTNAKYESARYKRFFGGRVKVLYTDKSFEEFSTVGI